MVVNTGLGKLQTGQNLKVEGKNPGRNCSEE